MTYRSILRAAGVGLVVLLTLAPTRARAQSFDNTPAPGGESRGGNTNIPVRGPADTEVVRGERGVINAPANPVIPVEEPLDPEQYICGRGDTFDLNFWGQQNFKLRITVDIEGRTFIPKIGYVDLVGKTLAQTRQIVKKAVARYYPGLNFDLSLVIPRTFLVNVIGFIARPALYSATPLDRVGTVLSRAGAISGSRRRIEIERRGGKRLTADLLMYELTGDPKYNPFLLDGDIVRVPYADVTVSISGPVKRPGGYELIASHDLAELLQLSGGFTATVTRQLPIRVVKRERERDVEVSLPFPQSGAPNVSLGDGDHVFVPTVAELQPSIAVIGPVSGGSAADEVTIVRRMTYFEGATVGSLLERAGGVGVSADLSAAFIRRQNGHNDAVDLHALLVLRDFTADRRVYIGDTIIVPQRRQGIAVEGAAARPGIYPYNPKFGGSDYINIAGGPSRTAQSSSHFRLISPTGATRALSSSAQIAPGDTIMLPERSFSRGEVVQLVMGGVGLLLSSVSVVILALRY